MSAATTCNYPRLDDTAQRLLWKIANAVYGALGSGGGAACSSESGAGAPTIAPTFIGQLYHDTVADTYYRSTGLTVADWVAVGGGTSFVTTTPPGQESLIGLITRGDIPGVTGITFNGTTSLGGLDFEVMPTLLSISFPNLVSVDPSNTQGGYFYISLLDSIVTVGAPNLITVGGSVEVSRCAVLTAISFPELATAGSGFVFSSSPSLTSVDFSSLATVGGDFNGSGNPALTSLGLPFLVSVTGTVQMSNCVALASVALPNLVPTNGTAITFNGDALDATSVDLILRRCVLAGVTTCTIDLGGGTNAGLTSLSAQGQADVAALTLAGNTVTTNP